MYKVLVNVWDGGYHDYITGEYSGITHSTREEAERELEHAKQECDAYTEPYIATTDE